MRSRTPIAVLVAASAILAALPAASQPGVPDPLQKVGFDQRLGTAIPGNLIFTDETGRRLAMEELFGDRPLVLALVYYECPMLCTLVMKGLTSSLKTLSFDAGRDYEVVLVSIDPEETPEIAAGAKALYLEHYDRPRAAAGWHFLTGGADAIAELARSVGFRYAYDEQTDQFAHAAGIVVLTPAGVVARYIYGIEYAPRDLRLALVEAAEGTIGSLVDQLLLYCYRYDPASGKYSAVALNLVRLGGVLTVTALGLFVAIMWRRDRRQPPPQTTKDDPR